MGNQHVVKDNEDKILYHGTDLNKAQDIARDASLKIPDKDKNWVNIFLRTYQSKGDEIVFYEEKWSEGKGGIPWVTLNFHKKDLEVLASISKNEQ